MERVNGIEPSYRVDLEGDVEGRFSTDAPHHRVVEIALYPFLDTAHLETGPTEAEWGHFEKTGGRQSSVQSKWFRVSP